jgi:hypothetical protein
MTKISRYLYKNYNYLVNWHNLWLTNIKTWLPSPRCRSGNYFFRNAKVHYTNKSGPYSVNPILLTSNVTHFLHLSQGIQHNLVFGSLLLNFPSYYSHFSTCYISHQSHTLFHHRHIRWEQKIIKLSFSIFYRPSLCTLCFPYNTSTSIFFANTRISHYS